MDRVAYTIDAAVEASGISRSVLYEHIKDGSLVVRYPSARPVIDADELADFIKALPTSPRRRGQVAS